MANAVLDVKLPSAFQPMATVIPVVVGQTKATIVWPSTGAAGYIITVNGGGLPSPMIVKSSGPPVGINIPVNASPAPLYAVKVQPVKADGTLDGKAVISAAFRATPAYQTINTVAVVLTAPEAGTAPPVVDVKELQTLMDQMEAMDAAEDAVRAEAEAIIDQLPKG